MHAPSPQAYISAPFPKVRQGDEMASSSSSSDNDEEEPRRTPGWPASAPFAVYKRRWLLLAVVCLLSSSNAMLWLTFAPVADKTAEHFHTTVDMVNWLSLVYLVISVPVGLLAIWILDTVGLKCSILLCAWLNMIGSVIRIFSIVSILSLGSLNIVYLLIGQCLCAAAQPLIIFSPTKLAAVWFPEHQRATANMIGSMSNPLGILAANLLSPALVKEGKDIPLMLGVYAGPAIFACVLATVGVRDKVPPTPPSASAIHSNAPSFFGGLKMLMRNVPYIILALCLGGGIAVFTCYSALLEQVLCVNGYSDVCYSILLSHFEWGELMGGLAEVGNSEHTCGKELGEFSQMPSQVLGRAWWNEGKTTAQQQQMNKQLLGGVSWQIAASEK